MKVVRIEVAVRPKARSSKGAGRPSPRGRLRTWLFGFVEGGLYTYQATLRSVGDEPVDKNDLQAVQFRWEFTTGQANVKGWYELQDRMMPGQSHVFPEVDHHVLSSGFALLYVHTLRSVKGVLGHPPLEISVQDSRGQAVPFEGTDTIQVDMANMFGANASSVHEGRSSFALESFRSLTSAEVKQNVLIGIALVALVFTAIFGLLNYLK